MKPPFGIAADLDTPVSAYLKLAPFKPRFLLESAAGGERLGRYSFIGFGDALEVRLDASGDRDAFLAALRRALATAPRPGPAIPGVPFAGGLVGVAGWEASHLVQGLPATAARAEGTAACHGPPPLPPRSPRAFAPLRRPARVTRAGRRPPGGKTAAADDAREA